LRRRLLSTSLTQSFTGRRKRPKPGPDESWPKPRQLRKTTSGTNGLGTEADEYCIVAGVGGDVYDLIERLEALIEKWENAQYTGDYTKATRSVCAKELREILGQPESSELHWVQDSSSNDEMLQRGYCDEPPF
jgi:hypothetical protein